MKNKNFSPFRPAAVVAGLLSTGMLLGCEAKPVKAAGPDAAQIQALATRMKAQLVLVKGGNFQMGDFGEIHAADKLPYTSAPQDGPVHKVTVSDFSISKYKVTLADYRVYAAANRMPLPYQLPDAAADDASILAHPESAAFPAGADWKNAKGYCQWIGKQMGKAMDLPTEAEWEYAARSRGNLVVYGTDNGQSNPGKNFPSFEQMKKYNGKGTGDIAVGKYPPNPLGLYEMGINGSEWTNDWYAKDYYAHSTGNNPQGPANGTAKVVRGYGNGATTTSMTFERNSREPELANSPSNVTNVGYGFRCVARSI